MGWRIGHTVPCSWNSALLLNFRWQRLATCTKSGWIWSPLTKLDHESSCARCVQIHTGLWRFARGTGLRRVWHQNGAPQRWLGSSKRPLILTYLFWIYLNRLLFCVNVFWQKQLASAGSRSSKYRGYSSAWYSKLCFFCDFPGEHLIERLDFVLFSM